MGARQVLSRSGGTRISAWLHRCVVSALLVLLWADPLRADPACSIARVLLASDAAARAVHTAAGEDVVVDDAVGKSAAGDDAVRQAVDALDRRLDRLAAQAAGAGETLAEPLAGFMASRRALVDIYRDRGLEAARAHVRAPAFGAARDAVRAVLDGRAACAGPAWDGPSFAEPRAAPEVAQRQDAAPRPRRSEGPRDSTGAARPAVLAHGEAAIPTPSPLALLALVLIGLVVLSLALAGPLEADQDARVPCHIATQLVAGGVARPAWIVELGRKGAKLRAIPGCRPGDRCEMLLAGQPTRVRVDWVNPSFVGVSFQQRLAVSPREIARPPR